MRFTIITRQGTQKNGWLQQIPEESSLITSRRNERILTFYSTAEEFIQ
jgi:hypothetical protein